MECGRLFQLHSFEGGFATTVVFAFMETKAVLKRGKSKFTSLLAGLFEILAPGTNPTRFDAGAYVDINGILYDIKSTITDAPESYFKKPIQKKILLGEVKVIETLLNSNANATAIIVFLDVMKSEANRWVVHQETKDALVLQIETEKTFVFVQRKSK